MALIPVGGNCEALPHKALSSSSLNTRLSPGHLGNKRSLKAKFPMGSMGYGSPMLASIRGLA